MIYGYARVSTKEQCIERQINSINQSGIKVDKIFSDKMSGKNFDREQYLEMKSSLQANDVVVFASLDRLGRDYDMIIEEWKDITTNIKADIVIIDMPLLDTRNQQAGLTGKFLSNIVLQILSYVADTEREFMSKRTKQGLAVARSKGIKLGRPKFELCNKFKELYNHVKEGLISNKEAYMQLNISKAQWFKMCKEIN